MKKILALFISMNFLIMPSYCAIVDTFAETSLDKSLKVAEKKVVVIQDSFVEKSLDKNLKISIKKKALLKDNFAESNKNKNIAVKQVGRVSEFLPNINSKNTISPKTVFVDTASAIEVPVEICKLYSTIQAYEEGDYIDFETTRDVVINKKTYPKGSIVKGRIENISLNKMLGVPADVVIGNFMLNNIPLTGEIEKTGANRALWVYPCAYGLSWFFGVGLLFLPIRGGHAKISKGITYTLYAR